MKTIQIPTTSNPFIVNINNHAYQYRAGETTEVPDEVAAAIEDALELEPKPKRYLSKLVKRVDGSITELTLGDWDGVEVIGNYAFTECKSLEKIEFPNSLKNIGSWAFSNCSGLINITIPNNVTSIAYRAFEFCTSLTSVTIGNGVLSIGSSAFQGCKELKRVYLPENTPNLANINTFADIKADCIFYCKTQASLDAYKAAVNWSTLAGTYAFVVEA